MVSINDFNVSLCSPPEPMVEVDEEQAFSHAMQLISSIALPMSLKAAAELGALEVIASFGRQGGDGLTAAEVAARINPTNSDNGTCVSALDRILRLLASYSVLSCSDDGSSEGGGVGRRYGASPALKYLVRGGDGGGGSSLAALGSLFFNKVHMDSWHYLKDFVVNEEIPFEKAHARSLYEYLSKDPMLSEIYNRASASHAATIMEKIIGKYAGFNSIKVLVDVAGGIGTSVAMIVSKYSHIKGINFDLPLVIAGAPSYPGVEHIGGDIFVSVPSGDALLLKWVLHSWGDEDCINILSNCWKAIPRDGEVLIVEYILPTEPEPNLVSQSMFNIDLVLLATSDRGKERTEDEYKSLAKQAGFNGFELLISYAGVCLFKLTK